MTRCGGSSTCEIKCFYSSVLLQRQTARTLLRVLLYNLLQLRQLGLQLGNRLPQLLINLHGGGTFLLQFVHPLLLALATLARGNAVALQKLCLAVLTARPGVLLVIRTSRNIATVVVVRLL